MTPICQECGEPIDAHQVYSNRHGGGPWHRLCIPPDINSFEQMLAREAGRRQAEAVAKRRSSLRVVK